MATIFLSHSSIDKAAAQQLKAWLEAAERGHQVFLDYDIQTGIKAGADWERSLYEQLRLCRVFLPILTQNWLDSKWCFAEMTHARAQGKLILPVKLDPALDSSNLFADLQQTPIDLSGDDQSGYQRLQRALEEEFSWNPERPPYPGLPAFQEEDAAIYSGRNPEIISVIELLEGLRRHGYSTPHFVLLLGASGSGKSSLARAGIMPRLRLKSEWLLLKPFMPRTNPIAELAETFARTFKDIPALQSAWPVHKLEQTLTRAAEAVPPDGKALLDLVRDLRTQRQDNATLLLVIDQTEELFVVSNPQHAKQFLGLLRAAIEQSDGRLMVLATMRSEFLGSFQQHPFIVDSHYKTPFEYETFTLDPLPTDRFQEIIRKPAELVGFTIDEDLVERMVADTATRDALPLLAYTLRRMWDNEDYRKDGRFELSEYQELGGLEGSIRKAADEALNSQRNKEELAALKSAFVPGMVKLSHEDEPVRQRTRRDQLSAEAYRLLKPFIKNRLLITDKDTDGHETLEVAHEALLRVWPQLTGWINEDRDKLHLFENLERAAQDWHKQDQQSDFLVHKNDRLKELLELVRNPRFQLREDSVENAYLIACEQAQHARELAEKEQQQKEIRNFRRRLAVAGIMLLIASLSAIYAFIQEDVAKKQTKIAQQQTIEAVKQKQEAEAQAAQTKAALIWSNLVFEHRKISPEETDILWELAAAKDSVREAFVEQLFDAEELSERFARKSRAITRALVGFDLQYRQKIIQDYLIPSVKDGNRLKNLLAASFLVKELSAIEGLEILINAILETENRSQISGLADGLDVLATKINAQSAPSLYQSLLAAIMKTENSHQISALAKGSAALEIKYDAAAAQGLLRSLATAILKANDSYHIEALGEDLVALATKIDAQSAPNLFQSLLAAILKTTSRKQISALADGLDELATKIDAQSAPGLFQSLVAAILKTENRLQISTLADGLDVLAPKIDAQSAPSLFQSLLTAILKTEYDDQIGALGRGLLALTTKIDAAAAPDLAQSLLAAILKTENYLQIDALSEGLAALDVKLDAATVSGPLQSLTTAILNLDAKDQIQTKALAKGLVALTTKIDAAAAPGVVQSLVAAILKTENYLQISALNEGLAALDVKLDAATMSGPLQSLTAAILNAEDYYNHTEALAKGLVALTTKIDAAVAPDLAQPLVAAIMKTEEDDQIDALGKGLAVLGTKIDAAAAQSLLQPVVAAIMKAKHVDQVRALTETLATLEVKIGAHSAQGVSNSLMAAILNAEDYYSHTEALAKGLVALTTKIDAAAAPDLAQTLVTVILNAETSYTQTNVLTEGLAALATKIDSAAAQGVSQLLVAAILQTENSHKISALADGLAALEVKFDAAAAPSLFQPLVAAILNAEVYYNHTEALAKGLVALTTKIDAAAAPDLAQTLVTAILNAETSYAQTNALTEGLAALATKIDSAAAQGVSQLLVAAILQTENSHKISALADGLVALEVKFDTAAAQGLLRSLATAILKANDSYHIDPLGKDLAALTSKIDAAAEPSIFNMLTEAYTNSRNLLANRYLEDSLTAVAAKLPANNYGIELVFKVLNDPTISRKTENTLLEIFHKHLFEAQNNTPIDLWEFVERAKEKYPELDFTSRDYAEKVLERRLAFK